MATTITAPGNLDTTGNIDDKLSKMINQLSHMNTHIREVRKEIKSDLKTIQASMGSLTKRIETGEEAAKKMNYTCLDLATKSCRSNLLFHGISEMDDEDVVETINSGEWGVYGHSATRLGRPGGRQGALRKLRPILATFPYERQRERVIDTARHTLQNTTKKVSVRDT